MAGIRRWSDDDVAYAARRYYDDKVSGDELAREMGARVGAPVNYRTIISLLSRRSNSRGRRQRDNAQGARLRDAGLKAAVAAGEPVAQIARRFGVSETAVYRAAPPTFFGFDRRGLNMRGGGVHPWDMNHAVDPALEGEVTADGVTFADLRHDGCRFPIGRDAERGYRFCGCATARRPYCQMHREIAYLPRDEDTEDRRTGVAEWMLGRYALNKDAHGNPITRIDQETGHRRAGLLRVCELPLPAELREAA